MLFSLEALTPRLLKMVGLPLRQGLNLGDSKDALHVLLEMRVRGTIGYTHLLGACGLVT